MVAQGSAEQVEGGAVVYLRPDPGCQGLYVRRDEPTAEQERSCRRPRAPLMVSAEERPDRLVSGYVAKFSQGRDQHGQTQLCLGGAAQALEESGAFWGR